MKTLVCGRPIHWRRGGSRTVEGDTPSRTTASSTRRRPDTSLGFVVAPASDGDLPRPSRPNVSYRLARQLRPYEQRAAAWTYRSTVPSAACTRGAISAYPASVGCTPSVDSPSRNIPSASTTAAWKSTNTDARGASRSRASARSARGYRSAAASPSSCAAGAPARPLRVAAAPPARSPGARRHRGTGVSSVGRIDASTTLMPFACGELRHRHAG